MKCGNEVATSPPPPKSQCLGLELRQAPAAQHCWSHLYAAHAQDPHLACGLQANSNSVPAKGSDMHKL